MNTVKSEVIVKPETCNIELTDLNKVTDSSALVRETFANIDTLGKKADSNLLVALRHVMTLSATEVRETLYDINPTTAYGRSGLIGLKKLYGLRFVSNMNRELYTKTIIGAINNGYTFSSIVDLTWSLISYSHGQEAKEQTMLSGRVGLTSLEPTMIDVNLLLNKYRSTDASFVDALAESFKLTFKSLDKAEKDKFQRYVAAGTQEEVGKLSVERGKVKSDKFDLEKDRIALEKKQAEFDKVKQNHSDTDAYQLIANENKTLMQQVGELDEVTAKLEESEKRENALVLQAEKVKESNEKALIAAEKKVKLKYQSASDKELETLKAKLESKAKIKADLIEAKRSADEQPTLPVMEKVVDNPESEKTIKELQAKLEHASKVLEEKDGAIEALEADKLTSDEVKARQAVKIKQLDDDVQSFAKPADKLISLAAGLDDLRDRVEGIQLSEVKTKAGLAKVQKKLIQSIISNKATCKV